jgi:heme exporter protein D
MNVKLMNLYMAVFWALLGGTVLFLDGQNGRVRWALPLNTDPPVSVGWLALALAGYNVIRWWVSRSLEANRRLLAAERERREREKRRKSAEPRERNPDFDFGPPPDPKG